MINEPIRIFCGVDPREAVGFQVFVHSLLARTSVPVQIMPIWHELFAIDGRGDSSTTFNYARFLVPKICGFKGHALWMDGSDMLLQDDIAKLWEHCDFEHAVKVVKHDYQPMAQTKFLGQLNPAYPRKNWSSVMLFWCEHMACQKLLAGNVKTMTGQELHRFAWCPDKLIGTLPAQWNYLVGERQPDVEPALLHYTNGIPAFEDYATSERSKEWWDEYAAMLLPLHEPERSELEPEVIVKRRGWPKGKPRKAAA